MFNLLHIDAPHVHALDAYYRLPLHDLEELTSKHCK